MIYRLRVLECAPHQHDEGHEVAVVGATPGREGVGLDDELRTQARTRARARARTHARTQGVNESESMAGSVTDGCGESPRANQSSLRTRTHLGRDRGTHSLTLSHTPWSRSGRPPWPHRGRRPTPCSSPAGNQIALRLSASCPPPPPPGDGWRRSGTAKRSVGAPAHSDRLRAATPV